MNNYMKTVISGLKQWISSQKSDWNQNDSSATNFIKNRPFYSEEKEKVLFSGSGPFENFWDDVHGAEGIAYGLSFTTGQIYKIIFDNVEYSCECFYLGGPAFGNASIVAEGADSGEPFFIGYTDDWGLCVYCLTEGTHSLSISGTVEEIHQIDKKFIPMPETPELSDVAYSGSYYDLYDTPYIPWDTVQYATSQSIPDSNKKTARNNIGAAAATDVNNLNTTVSGLNTTVSGLNTTVSGLNTTVSGLNTTVSGLNTTVNSLNTQIEDATDECITGLSVSGKVITYTKGDGSKGTITTQDTNTTYSNATTSTAGLMSAYDKSKLDGVATNIKNGKGMYNLRSIGASAENDSYSLGYASIALGGSVKAPGDYSHAVGYNTTASGERSHAEGDSTTASGRTSHAEGSYTAASGMYSHAEGQFTIASGNISHAEGSETIAYGQRSHAEGGGLYSSITISGEANSTVYQSSSVSSSYSNRLIVYNGLVARIISVDNINKTFTLDKTLSDSALVDVSVKIYYNGFSIGVGSHVEGINNKTLGDCSHAEGSSTTASGERSHAEGDSTTASGRTSHAEGGGTTASGDSSHAEGGGTKASGSSSHAEGYYSIASGEYSHAEGSYTTAYGQGSHVEGRGRCEQFSITGEANATEFICSRSTSSIEIDSYFIYNDQFFKIIDKTDSTIIIDKVLSDTAITNKGIDIYSKGAFGDWSHAEGSQTTASGNSSHAEGSNTTASGDSSHAEGYFTTAINIASHAEGRQTESSGEASHAEGWVTTASGDYSHAEGDGTIAASNSQHVQGKYNIEDSASKYAHIVGNGTYTSHSNAHTLDWDGNAWFEGKIKVGGTGYDDPNAVEVALKSDLENISAPSGGNVELDTTLTQSGKAADAKAVGKAFSDRIEGGYFDDTGNLVFEDKVTIGSYIQNDGKIVGNAYTGTYCVTDYLAVKPSTSYALFTEVGVVFNCAQYREDRTFIEGTIVSYPTLVTTNAECAYLVACFRNANDSVGQGCLVVKQSTERVYEYTPPKDVPLKFVGVDYATIGEVQTIVGDTDVKLNLPDKYELVAGDEFELFWSGVIVSTNPECYSVDVTCEKGTPFKRFFRYLPSGYDVGTYDMVVKLYNYKHNLVAEKTVQLVVKAKATSPANKTVVMYVGDSLTANGYVPDEMHRRLTATNGTPVGDGLSNIVFIGDKVSTENGVPYVGTGGWTFDSYISPMVSAAFMTVTTDNNTKTDADQHSVYADSNGVQWKIETVRTGQLDIIRVSDTGTLPASGTLTWVSGGVDHSAIVYTASTQAAGNPFWDNETGKVNVAKFVSEQGEQSLDYMYVLLGWNASYIQKPHYVSIAKEFIGYVLADFPNCKIVLMGLQMPSWDGCAQNYGAKSDVLCHRHELINYVYNHDLWCAEIAESYPNNVSYLNISGQFDSENNMPTATRKLNARNSTTETYQINGVHPAVSGYMQIADACYRDITHKLQSN